MATWLVETAWRTDGYLPAAWRVRSGYGSKAAADAEVRQLGAKWRRSGHSVRVREVSEDA